MKQEVTGLPSIFITGVFQIIVGIILFVALLQRYDGLAALTLLLLMVFLGTGSGVAGVHPELPSMHESTKFGCFRATL